MMAHKSHLVSGLTTYHYPPKIIIHYYSCFKMSKKRNLLSESDFDEYIPGPPTKIFPKGFGCEATIKNAGAAQKRFHDAMEIFKYQPRRLRHPFCQVAHDHGVVRYKNVHLKSVLAGGLAKGFIINNDYSLLPHKDKVWSPSPMVSVFFTAIDEAPRGSKTFIILDATMGCYLTSVDTAISTLERLWSPHGHWVIPHIKQQRNAVEVTLQEGRFIGNPIGHLNAQLREPIRDLNQLGQDGIDKGRAVIEQLVLDTLTAYPPTSKTIVDYAEGGVVVAFDERLFHHGRIAASSTGGALYTL